MYDKELVAGSLHKILSAVYWSGIMRMRDKIAHHYFEIDTDVVFRTIQEDVPQLVDVVKRMISDIEQ